MIYRLELVSRPCSNAVESAAKYQSDMTAPGAIYSYFNINRKIDNLRYNLHIAMIFVSRPCSNAAESYAKYQSDIMRQAI